MSADDFKGLDLTHGLNRIPARHAASAVNVRPYLRAGVQLRDSLTNPIITIDSSVQSIARMNDTTPAGPGSGYTIISASSSGKIFNNATSVASGLSTNPVSIVPSRPDASVQPWAYVGDSAAQGAVTLATKYLISGSPVNFPSTGMLKVRSDGLSYKIGIKEPQLAVILGTGNSVVVDSGPVPATTLPWTIAQKAGFDFGQTNAADGTNPIIINVLNASTVTLTVTGSATVNGGAHAPGDAGANTVGYPGQFVQNQAPSGAVPGTADIVVGTFVEADGLTIVPHALSPFKAVNPVNIGAGVTLNVPANAATLQLGINSLHDAFNANSGSFAFNATVNIVGVANVLSSFGPVTTYYWNDSPHSGSVAEYIWKNPNDPIGSGPARTISDALTTTTGTSFWFVDTGNNLSWNDLNFDGSIAGSKLITTKGASNFNLCVVGELFVPVTGNYTFKLDNKDRVIWAIEGATVVSQPPGSRISDYMGQTISVVEGLPLLPVLYLENGLGGQFDHTTVVLNLTAGIHKIEIDYDYWYHSYRLLQLTASPTPGAAVATIPPISGNVRINVSYACKYRSSATGAQSNPGPESTPVTSPVLSNTISSPWSNDPQCDKVDYYRQDQGLADYTYVATGPNDGLGGTINGVIYNTPITDALTDLEAASGQLMQRDDFEPFPSIDLPKSGVINVLAGAISWVSGDKFNIRWLAGTVIEIGAPTQLAYSLIARPASTTSMTIPGVPDGTNLTYNISQPILAAQPLPYLFGPTDNINFVFGVGDPLRPGTLYWCKGSNLDSAPDTNQLEVTDPSEALVNGAMSGGRGVLFSIKRAWVIMPNFYNALATVTGTSGSTWSLQDTAINRGLFIPRCLAVEGGGKIFFRVDDGIHFSPNGLASKSITDDTLYPLFSHEGSTPVPITRNGITFYPPNDALPQRQKFQIVDSYLYYDYLDTNSVPRTLVFDIEAMAWVWDIYTPQATAHAPDLGESTQGVLVGCADGTIRNLSSAGTEAETATVLTPAIGGAGWQHMQQVTVEYSSNAAVTLSFIAADANNGSYGPPPVTLPSTSGAQTKYTFKVGANKWKWMQFQFQWIDPACQIFLDGFVAECKDWGSDQDYRPVRPFAPAGGLGSEP